MSEHRRYYLVAPLAYTGDTGSFTYHFDAQALEVGQIVTIPLGRRLSQGIIMTTVEKPLFNTKSISAAVDVIPLPAYLLELGSWMSAYYSASSSSVWSTMLPTGIAKNRRALKPRTKLAVASGLPQYKLTEDQVAALKSIRTSPRTTHLLQGVTGSGKTRVYLELAEEALRAGRSVIILVPEITLTPQVVAQFEEVFGEAVISTHSKLTEAQRHAIWSAASQATEHNQPRIIVGPRSCLFLPLHDLGLIVVDEAHETSYKQEQHPRYNAVTVAAKLAGITGSRLVLGSATPGLTELFLAQSGRIEHVIMSHKANDIAHLQAKIIDLRNKDDLKLSKFIAQPLIDAVSATLQTGRQSLLYLNRRGSASSQVCGDCGHVSTCPNCLLPLTFHADWMRLVCHHCNYRRVSEAVCPECGGMDIKLLGGGTKRIEAEVERLWPQARIARLDRDSATLSYIKEVYAGLKKGTIDIIIGTQMIAKGLDLPRIDTVGVVTADTMLHLPDFGAAERTFQLLSQVSGRAGRGDRAGEIYIQTYTPGHPAIVAAASGDYAGFAASELQQRQLLGYPPYSYLLKLTVTGRDRATAVADAEAFAGALRRHVGLIVTGPAPAFIETQGERYHWIITVKSARRTALVQITNQLPGDHWTADLDPINLL
jgi:primosomal protein N' (replication factor Y)